MSIPLADGEGLSVTGRGELERGARCRRAGPRATFRMVSLALVFVLREGRAVAGAAGFFLGGIAIDQEAVGEGL